MNILHPRQYLLHKGDGLLLVQPFLADDVVEQLSARGVLHYEVDICFCLYYLP